MGPELRSPAHFTCPLLRALVLTGCLHRFARLLIICLLLLRFITPPSTCLPSRVLLTLPLLLPPPHSSLLMFSPPLFSSYSPSPSTPSPHPLPRSWGPCSHVGAHFTCPPPAPWEYLKSSHPHPSWPPPLSSFILLFCLLSSCHFPPLSFLLPPSTSPPPNILLPHT